MQTAKGLLLPAQPTNNNMGILCLLEGNRDKAEVYLTMATAAGVEQAIKALEKLKIKD